MEEGDEAIKFSDFGLNARLEKSISNVGWQVPTLVQEKAIRFGLEGKDLLIKGRTGCGKTGAFLIPIIHNLLELKRSADQLAGIRCLILSPSKELCRQTAKICKELNFYTSKEISILDLTEEVQFMKKFLLEKPDIVIATPSKLLQQLKNVNLNPALADTLRFLVIDEADLMFSFGYREDMNELLGLLPKGECQTFLASATLNTDIVNLKELFLSNPIIIKLTENETNEKIVHYHMYAEEEDKFVLLNALFKFKLMTGRSLIFVNTVNKCYKLKIFLEQFGVRSVLLNSELPLTSRCHAIDQFNRGIYDIIIANDEKCVSNPEETKKKSSGKFKKDKEFNVSRGIDFQNVDNVINFDFPETMISYIHRVGRTGRGPHEDTDGTVLSLVNTKEKQMFLNVVDGLDQNSKFKKFNFRLEELESIRYRTKDAFNMITKVAINEARVKEIRQELLNSEKLKSYFRANLKDFKALKQDKSLHTVKPQQHLKNIPDYIVPDSLQSLMKSDTSKRKWYDDERPFYQAQANRVKKKRSNTKKSNPLRSFSVKRKK